ncbi:MAG TPA: type II and III secretion system protein family protein [Rhizomicrobium sp.]|jgi:pilus assembly protein CpaC|nr:type II and III secretion system protein family protein [Rhizomicrobium sp.]
MRSAVLTLTILAAALAASPAGAEFGSRPDAPDARVINVSAHGSGPAHEHLTLALDKAAIVQLDADARDVLVSNPAIVDAVVRTSRRVYLLGMKTGQTNAFFFDAAGHQILSLDIQVERDVAGLTSLLRADFPGSDIKVTALNDNIVLNGSVQSAEQATRAQDLAERFATPPGKTPDPSTVVNLLKVKGREQVLIKVRVSEIERDIAKQLGINLSSAFTAAGVPIALATSNPFGLGQVLSAASGGQIGNIGVPGAPGPNNVQGILNALDQVGLDHTLAEPNLVAVSGETAKFLAGGEFPVPISRDLYGNVTIEFKTYGVALAFTPVVLSENRISLQVSTEVSELTNEGAFVQSATTTVSSTGQPINVASLTIPALAVRRAETTVELPSGGSFAIAGLLQHTTKEDIDAFPGLKDMPVLGALFRSRDFQNNETELVIVVSAYLVDPTHETKLSVPTDGFIPATDPQQDLLGKFNTSYRNDPQGLKSAADGKAGFIVE